MSDPRYTSPIPPYQGYAGAPASGSPAAGPHSAGPHAASPLEGVVVGGPGRPSGTPGLGPGFGSRLGADPRPRFVRQKSLLLAALLAFVFPPIGMLYSTVFGTFVMILVGLVVAIVTAGQGLAALWPVCVVWAVWAAHRKNQRRLAWAAMGF